MSGKRGGRHIEATEKDVHEPTLPLEIHITTDTEAKTLTISDSGMGMTREELYKALAADGNPELSTVLKVVKALGLQFHAVPVKAKKAIRKRPAGQSATTL